MSVPDMKPTGSLQIRSQFYSGDVKRYKLWWNRSVGWGGESSASNYTLDEAQKQTLPLGGEWMYAPANIKDDNNEEEMDVSNSGDVSDDNHSIDQRVAAKGPQSPTRE